MVPPRLFPLALAAAAAAYTLQPEALHQLELENLTPNERAERIAAHEARLEELKMEIKQKEEEMLKFEQQEQQQQGEDPPLCRHFDHPPPNCVGPNPDAGLTFSFKDGVVPGKVAGKTGAPAKEKPASSPGPMSKEEKEQQEKEEQEQQELEKIDEAEKAGQDAAQISKLNLGTKPHIVISLVDDLGFADVGFNTKNPHAYTPFVDSLAHQGVILDRHYGYAFCSPSRSSLMSGRYPHHVNQFNPDFPTVPGGVDSRMTIMPAMLKKAGYETAMVGKWHLGMAQPSMLPAKRGFDKHLGMLMGWTDHWNHKWAPEDHEDREKLKILGAEIGFDDPRGTDLWEGLAPAAESTCAEEGPNNTLVGGYCVGQHSCDMVGGTAVRYIEEHKGSGPLFLFISWHEVHAPSQTAPGDLKRLGSLNAKILGSAGFSKLGKGDDVHAKRASMESMIACMDDGTKRVVSALQRQKMWDNTLLLWMADNGGVFSEGANNWPLRGQKSQFFEGGVRLVSFLAGGALPKEAPSRLSKKIHVADWYTTFARLAGLSSAKDPSPQVKTKQVPDVDGLDVWSVISGGADEVRHEVPLAVYPEGRFCDGVDDPRPSHHHPVNGKVWCPKKAELARGVARLYMQNSSFHPHLPHSVSLYQEESWATSRSALIMGDYKIVNAGGALVAGYTKQDFPYSLKGQAYGEGVETGVFCPKEYCLFNLEDDPYERNDLSMKWPALYERLTARFEELQKNVF
jgi:arylsulfatase A-like enzyme